MRFLLTRVGYCLIVGIVMILPSTVAAQDTALSTNVNFTQIEISLRDLLEQIERQVSIHFSYDSRNIASDLKIVLPGVSLTPDEIFEQLEEQFGIQVVKKGNVMILQRKKKQGSKQLTISGTVRDRVTGEVLPGAQIILTASKTGGVTNQYGFYSLSGTQKNELVEVRYVGYETIRFQFPSLKDSTADFSMEPGWTLLQDIVVTGDSLPSESAIQSHDGNFKISAVKVKETPSFAGEPDVLKVLQFLPGVQSGNEGTTNLSVRGGSFDQNLYLLDEAPVYNPSHSLSFFSIFNPDAVQSTELYKGAIPAMYGGRLSSVIDVRMREGNRVKNSYSGAIGTIASRLTVEGPLTKKDDRTSYIVSGRYGYAGHVVNGIYLIGSSIFSDPTANNSTTDNKIGFYDLNAKINFRKSAKDHFYLSLYSGHDKFYFNHITSGYAMSWGNNTATLRWNRIHSPKLFSNSTILYSNYKYEYRVLNNTQYFLWSAGFKEIDVKQDYNYYPHTDHHITFGWGVDGHFISPGTVAPRSATAVTRTQSLQDQKPVGTYLYLANDHLLKRSIRLSYGLRYSNFIIQGKNTRYLFEGDDEFPYDSITFSSGDVEKIYHRLEPRLSLQYQRKNSSLTISYDRMSQYLHLLANSSVGLPTDVWLPSGGRIQPQMSDIYSINLHHNFNTTWQGSIGGFYKNLQNVLDFKDNANLFVNKYFESQLLQGKGTAYGVEFFMQKTREKFTGSISYTWSKAMNVIEGVNGDKPFPSRYDKRHNISFTGKHILSKRWEASVNFVYTTGGALTVPAGNFTFDGVAFNYYSDRNSFRLPDYHRMDVSLRYNSKKNDNRRFQSSWSFDVYNVYGRKNPFTVYSQQQDYYFQKTQVNAIYLFKVVPTISYNFKF
jgi:hypothetical protein